MSPVLRCQGYARSASPASSLSSWDDNYPRSSSPAPSVSSVDEDEVNVRVYPHWPAYADLFQRRGFRLETVRDVKRMYPSESSLNIVCDNEDSLCPDPGLPDNLFRGTRVHDGLRVMVKSVHRRSRERDIIFLLSAPPLSEERMNHCIPVLDIVDVDEDLSFIIMEEWSSELTSEICCPLSFLSTLRQCIEHAVFMHQNRIAHLDISLRNLLTDSRGNCSYIDFETSRRFDGVALASIYGYRGTEIPPECDNGGWYDPYKIDVWALAVLVVRASQLIDFCLPSLKDLLRSMLHEDPDLRPTMYSVLSTFNKIAADYTENIGTLGSCSH